MVKVKTPILFLCVLWLISFVASEEIELQTFTVNTGGSLGIIGTFKFEMVYGDEVKEMRKEPYGMGQIFAQAATYVFELNPSFVLDWGQDDSGFIPGVQASVAITGTTGEFLCGGNFQTSYSNPGDGFHYSTAVACPGVPSDGSFNVSLAVNPPSWNDAYASAATAQQFGGYALFTPTVIVYELDYETTDHPVLQSVTRYDGVAADNLGDSSNSGFTEFDPLTDMTTRALAGRSSVSQEVVLGEISVGDDFAQLRVEIAPVSGTYYPLGATTAPPLADIHFEAVMTPFIPNYDGFHYARTLSLPGNLDDASSYLFTVYVNPPRLSAEFLIAESTVEAMGSRMLFPPASGTWEKGGLELLSGTNALKADGWILFFAQVIALIGACGYHLYSSQV